MRARQPAGAGAQRFAAAAWRTMVVLSVVGCGASCGDMRPSVSPVLGADEELCPAYCSLAMACCQAPVRLFSTLAECQESCAALPAGGQLGSGSGDNVACRLTYLLAEPRPSIAMCTYARPHDSPACR